MSKHWTVRLVPVDQPGSAIAVKDSDISWRSRYLPFGYSPKPGSGRMGFTGHLREPGGSYLLGNGKRIYVPSVSRFGQPDALSPFAEGGLSTYVYCGMEPVSRVDPSGSFPVTVLTAAAVFAAGGLGVAGAVMVKKNKSLGTGLLVAGGIAGIMAIGGGIWLSRNTRLMTVARERIQDRLRRTRRGQAYEMYGRTHAQPEVVNQQNLVTGMRSGSLIPISTSRNGSFASGYAFRNGSGSSGYTLRNDSFASDYISRSGSLVSDAPPPYNQFALPPYTDLIFD